MKGLKESIREQRSNLNQQRLCLNVPSIAAVAVMLTDRRADGMFSSRPVSTLLAFCSLSFLEFDKGQIVLPSRVLADDIDLS